MKKRVQSDCSSMSSSSSSSFKSSGYRTRGKVKAEKDKENASTTNNMSVKCIEGLEKMTSSAHSTGGSTVQVSVRVRPLVHAEVEHDESVAWRWGEDNTICQDPEFIPQRTGYNKDGERLSVTLAGYTFDNLYTPDSTNQHIYESNIHDIVHQTLRGYHGTVFTYGQTSSGKTFTMNGTLKQPGIIPQAIYDCFESISMFNDREFLFRVSYMEVYNETVR